MPPRRPNPVPLGGQVEIRGGGLTREPIGEIEGGRESGAGLTRWARLALPESRGLRRSPQPPAPSAPRAPRPPRAGRASAAAGRDPDPESGPSGPRGPGPGSSRLGPPCPPRSALHLRPSSRRSPAPPTLPRSLPLSHCAREEMGQWARKPRAPQERASLQGTGRARGRWQGAEPSVRAAASVRPTPRASHLGRQGFPLLSRASPGQPGGAGSLPAPDDLLGRLCALGPGWVSGAPSTGGPGVLGAPRPGLAPSRGRVGGSQELAPRVPARGGPAGARSSMHTCNGLPRPAATPPAAPPAQGAEPHLPRRPGLGQMQGAATPPPRRTSPGGELIAGGGWRRRWAAERWSSRRARPPAPGRFYQLRLSRRAGRGAGAGRARGGRGAGVRPKEGGQRRPIRVEARGAQRTPAEPRGAGRGRRGDPGAIPAVAGRPQGQQVRPPRDMATAQPAARARGAEGGRRGAKNAGAGAEPRPGRAQLGFLNLGARCPGAAGPALPANPATALLSGEEGPREQDVVRAEREWPPGTVRSQCGPWGVDNSGFPAGTSCVGHPGLSTALQPCTAHPRVLRGPPVLGAPRDPPRPKRAEPAQQVVGGWKAPRPPRLPRGRPGQQRKALAPQVAGAGGRAHAGRRPHAGLGPLPAPTGTPSALQGCPLLGCPRLPGPLPHFLPGARSGAGTGAEAAAAGAWARSRDRGPFPLRRRRGRPAGAGERGVRRGQGAGGCGDRRSPRDSGSGNTAPPPQGPRRRKVPCMACLPEAECSSSARRRSAFPCCSVSCRAGAGQRGWGAP
ncbi:unnamed protein product [Nyctereutes procyonoides]|uniref:(raccoon dog) hypothetical protein n=1 Tax=Nyctereutes procyonoides TaxID=34880 RepID=A0A811Z2I2_NYCPR|nr:unnamed protein product [Nyctereutes procyonoides]